MIKKKNYWNRKVRLSKRGREQVNNKQRELKLFDAVEVIKICKAIIWTVNKYEYLDEINTDFSIYKLLNWLKKPQ